ncbi:Phosphotransferase enzyme family protein [Labrenzia sp. THAF191b]|uniref:phosphotransferase n=1 Tax=Labrenzia sp. THAF191a TaxID=2587866 RepID=UPI0012A86CEF|nr:phosphotransferase [Labrenzia sp. THAF191a]QFS98012.1 Phosphotransferase enzyme family protein [Labrenzia sp. THAF191b]QFT04326.1 Phosphotransferase enzyme family protein [Labrenzia sp. THAF191a]QFT15870.1 Phosphotransferase enzyme family protein [Labrenzia sp. THAF187b]
MWGPLVRELLSDSELLAFLKTLLPVKDWSVARLRPLPVAYTARFWRLDTPGRSYVIKEFFPENEDNPLYPTLPRQEADALAVLARHGLSPELEAFTYSPAKTPLLIYGYPTPVDNEIDVGEAAELIGRFAALSEPVPGHQTVPAGYHEVLARGDAMLALIPHSRKAANLKRSRPADGAVKKREIKRSLVHRSFCLGTIQATGDGARLIDWQFAGLGDPVEDIACFVSPGLATLYGLHPLVAHAEEMFLTRYPDQETVEHFLKERGAYHWCLAAYCLFRHETLMHSNAPAARAYGRALEEEVDLLLRLRGR